MMCCCIDYSGLMNRDEIQLQDVKECFCIDYSVLMYRDEIQLQDVKKCYWYELHAPTSNG